MGESAIQEYCGLLERKLVEQYSVSAAQASAAVASSAIQTLLREEPEYVNHVPLASWAEEVYEEKFAGASSH